MPHEIFRGHTYKKILFVVYLKCQDLTGHSIFLFAKSDSPCDFSDLVIWKWA